MAFKVVNDVVINDNTNINVDGMDVLVGDGNPTTKVLLQNVQLTTNVLSDSNLTTDNLTEGTTNLYFNDLRAQAALAGDIATLQADIANAIVTANSYTDQAETDAVSTANLYTDDREVAITTAYQTYTDAAVSGGTGSLTTDDILEGANLYYTDARVDSRIPTTLSAFTNDSNFATEAYSDQSELDANLYTDAREIAITTAYTSAIAAASATGSSGSNAYTDQEVANAITTMTAYTDQAETDAIATAATDATNKDTALQSAMQTYTDQAETDAVTTSNAYTDAREIAITTAYQTYADQAETDAKAYTDTRETAITTAYQTYADQAETDAKAYTDTRETAITTAYQTYADQAETDAKAYTDAREIAITTAYQTYADQAETDAKAYTDSEVANLVDSAPAVLDTLNELAAALGDDPSFATTVSNDIGTKVSKSGDTMTGDLTLAGAPTSANHAATKSYVDSAVASGTGSLDTDAIPEGASNLYYTDARVDARIPTNISAFTNDSNYATTSQLFSGNYNDLTNTPTNISAFTNDSNYATTSQLFSGSYSDLTNTPTNISAFTNDENYVTELSLEQHLGDSSVDGTIGNTVYHRILASKNDAIADANSYTDTEIAALPSIPTNISSFTNDAGYITSYTDTNTTYSAGNGISLSSTTFSVAAGNGLTQEASGLAMSGSFTGTFTASGDICAYSDQRLKRNIKTIDNAVDTVQNLRGVTFEKSLQPSLGVIAQEVEEVLPELVHTDEDGMKSVAYGNMVGLLIEAIKEQQKQIEDLKQRLENT